MDPPDFSDRGSMHAARPLRGGSFRPSRITRSKTRTQSNRAPTRPFHSTIDAKSAHGPTPTAGIIVCMRLRARSRGTAA